MVMENIWNDGKSKFDELFGQKIFATKPIFELFELQLGKTPDRSNINYWNSKDYKWISVSDMGKYDRLTSETEEYISNLAVVESNIKQVPKDTVIMSFKLTIGRTAITSEPIYTNEAIIAFIDKKNTYISNEYLRFYLKYRDWTFGMMNAVKGYTLNKDSIGKTMIDIPNKDLQDAFEIVVEQYDKLKFIV